jgi:hypothetical protein
MRVWTVLVVSVATLFTQSGSVRAQSADGAYWNQNLTAGYSYFSALGSTSTDAPSGSGWSVNYAFRPVRGLALEAGVEGEPSPVGTYEYDANPFNAHDYLFLIPFGARYVWQPRSAPGFQLSVGGGGAYLNHHFGTQYLFDTPSNDSVWGAQAVVSVRSALTRSRHILLGVTARYYRFYPQYNKLSFLAVGPDITFAF